MQGSFFCPLLASLIFQKHKEKRWLPWGTHHVFTHRACVLQAVWFSL